VEDAWREGKEPPEGVVFAGVGEPLLRFDVLKDSAKRIKVVTIHFVLSFCNISELFFLKAKTIKPESKECYLSHSRAMYIGTGQTAGGPAPGKLKRACACQRKCSNGSRTFCVWGGGGICEPDHRRSRAGA
jgi:hypothetical protein